MSSSTRESNIASNSLSQHVVISDSDASQERLELPYNQKVVALLPWGDRFEDFFDTVGISFEGFCTELTGGWLFNYIDALKCENIRVVIYFFSSRVDKPLHFTHLATGAKVCILPVSRIYRFVRGLVDSKSIPGLSTLAAYLATPLNLLAQELRQEGCGAILCQEYEYARFDLCVFLGQLMHIPVFASFQGGSKQLSKLEYLPRVLALQGCKGLIIGSQIQIQKVQGSYNIPAHKIAQIFNPMDVKNWKAIDRAHARLALGIPLEARVAVYHGRIEIERKGLDILLEAWQKICNVRPEKDLRLLLMGTGTDAEELQQRIDDMQLKGIMWLNEYVRDRSVINQYLSAADAYVLPSRHEGFPVAPIEAMATSLPVVAAEAPGVRDILNGGESVGGLVVPIGNSAALASSLGSILDDPRWSQELGRRARSRVEEHFSLEVIGKQLRQFLFS